MAAKGSGDFLSKTRVEGDCMLWTGATNGMGIGVLRRDGKNHKAHRFAWEMIHGPLRVDQRLLRTCQTLGCINPGHMLRRDVELTEAQRRSLHYKGCPGTRPVTPARERFLAQVAEGPTVRAELGPCLDWVGGLTNTGYGSFYDGKGKCVLAHRASYEFEHGSIDEALDCCHACDRRNCVRPAHLFMGTHQDNMDDMLSKGRRASKLSARDVVEIRNSTKAPEELADEFGVKLCTIVNVLSRATWYYVTDDGEIAVANENITQNRMAC